MADWLSRAQQFLRRIRPLSRPRISPLLGTLRTAMLLTLFFAATLALATQVRQINLEEMTQRAGRIFSGRCTAVQIEHNPTLNIDILAATFKVERAVKGVVGKTITLRTPAPEGTEKGRGHGISGVPTFRKGEEVVLFLYGESSLGLSSPVGLGQGKFSIITDGKKQKKIAVNEYRNRDLLRGLSSGAARRIGRSAHKLEDRNGVDPSVLLDAVEALRP